MSARPLPVHDLRDRVRVPDGGFTVDPRTGREITDGYAVSVHEERSKDVPEPDLTPADLETYVDNNDDLFADQHNEFGGWNDPRTNRVWLDVSTVVDDERTAVALGRAHDQIAVFDLGHGKEIPIDLA